MNMDTQCYIKTASLFGRLNLVILLMELRLFWINIFPHVSKNGIEKPVLFYYSLMDTMVKDQNILIVE